MKYFYVTFWMLFFAHAAHPLTVEEFEPDKTMIYKTVDETELRLHLFFPPDHKASDKSPAIVFFFGGGWKGGSPSQFYPHCEYLASRGMVAMAAEYRVASRNQTSPMECIKDAKSAIRWIRENARELGVDPDAVLAGGGSAGGHMAAAAGTNTAFEEEGENLSVSSSPQALVLFNPVFDNGPNGYGYSRVKDYWREFSPMHNISNTTPPTIVFLGTEDHLIPVETAQEYKRLMENEGGRCELYLYEGEGHGFFNYQKQAMYTETLLEVDRFLSSLGYLQGEPTL